MENIYNHQINESAPRWQRFLILLTLVIFMIAGTSFNGIAQPFTVNGDDKCAGETAAIVISGTVQYSFYHLLRTVDGVNYEWETFVVGQGSSIPYAPQSVTGKYVVYQYNTYYAGIPASEVVEHGILQNGEVNIFDIPVPTISGESNPCARSTWTYTTEPGKSNYIWTIVGGIATTSTSNTIDVTWNNTTGAGSVQVAYQEHICTGTSVTYAVTIEGAAQIVGGNIYCSIQDAIDASAENDIINVFAGTYNETLNINKAHLTIKGVDRASVIISSEGKATNNAGIYVNADNVTLQSLTLQSLVTNPLPRYGIKFSEVDGCTLEDVTVHNVYRSGIDVIGTSNLTINNVNSYNNGGHGLALTDCNGVDVSNVTFNNNGWQNVSVATWGDYTPLGTSDIVFFGVNSFGNLFQLEMGDKNNPGIAPTGEAIITYSTNITDGADVTVQSSDVSFAMHGTQDDAPGQSRIWLMDNLANAKAVIGAAPFSHFTGDDMFIEDLVNTDQYYVPVGGTIQAAIDAANPGDDINVDPGTFNENLAIAKELNLLGAGSNQTILSAATGIAIEITGEQVKIDGFEIKHSSIASLADMGIRINMSDGATIQNNKFSSNSLGIQLLDAGSNQILNNEFNTNAVGIFLEGTTDGNGNIDGGDNGPFYSLSLNNTIEGNTIANSISLGGEGGVGIYVDAACKFNSFDNNTITNSAGSGYYAWKASNNILTDNTFSNNGTEGIHLMGSSGNIVTGNTITDNTENGILLRSGALSSTGNTISSNTVTGSATGILLSDDVSSNNYVGFVSGNTINNNNIFGNNYGLQTLDCPASTVYTAENNWWGNANGPNHAVYNTCGTGDEVVGTVDFDTWLDDVSGIGNPVSNPVVNTDLSMSYCKIQDAINDQATNNGHTITAVAETFMENLSVDKELTFQGANIGTPGYGSRSTESTIDGFVKISADNVTFNGFKFLNGEQVPAGEKAAVHIVGGHSGFNFINNLFLKTDGTAPTSGDSFRGIINEFGGISTINVQFNKFEGWATGLFLQHATSATVQENVFFENYVGISNDFPEGVSITNNEITDNGVEGVGIGGTFGSADINVNYNKINGNPSGVANWGATLINATCNWWGTADASAIQTNTSGDVQFLPYSTIENTASCDGNGPITVWNNTHTTLKNSYMTIKAAIADDGTIDSDIIEVAAGTYTENVVVNKAVTIEGPQKDVDPRIAAALRTSGSSSEAIVNGGGSTDPVFDITVAGVVLNGIEITNGTGDLVSSPSGAPVKTGVIVQYCIFSNAGDEGIQLRNVEGGGVEYCYTYSTVGDGINLSDECTNSYIKNNQVSTSASADAAIYLYGNGPFMVVDNNLVSGVTSANGIMIGNKSGADKNKNSSFTNNAIVSNNIITGHTGSKVGVFVNTSRVNVIDNTITNWESSDDAALYLRWDIKDIQVTGNNISGNENGIKVSSGVSAVNALTFLINENNLSGNTTNGLKNGSAGTVSATCNWFGTIAPSEVGALISGVVNYTPWLIDGTDASIDGIGFQPAVTCDEIVPLAGQLTMITNKHAAPGIQISAPVNGTYEITIPLSFNGVDVFQSLSVIVTDDNLNTQNVPVIINGTQNGEMVYNANAQIWNYENQTIEPEFQDGSQTLTATFKDNAGNTTPLILKFTTDATVPMAGQLVMITKFHPEPGLQVTVPVDGVYAIATPLSFNGLDVFQSLSIVVTDLNLNTANVPVYINSIENGYMQYDVNEGIWNYTGQSGAPTFTDGLQTLTATFADNVGNTTSLQLTFITDATAPVITQSGNSTVFLCQNNEYIDDGATAADITAGDLTNNIVTGGDVVTSENPGTYTITYNVTDAAGNPAPEVIRTVVVNPNPTFSGLTTNATSPVCYGAAISFTANGLLNGTNQFTYTVTGTGPGLPINNAVATANVTGGSYMFPAPLHPYAPGEYLVTINSITIDDCTTDFLENNSVNFTVNPLPTASISGELESCVSTKLIAETDASSPSFIWYKGTEPIDGQISSSLDVIESGEYNVKVTNGITNCNAISDVVSVIIYPETVAGAVTGGTSVCSGSTSGELTLGTHTGDVTRWESSVDPFTTWTPIANTTDAYTSGGLTATTKFRAIVKSGVCSEVPSTETTVTVYGTVITSGVVDGSSDLTLCDGGNPQAFNVGNAIGGDENYSYQWEESVNGSGIWVNATAQVGTSTTDLSFNPPALFATVTTVQYRLKISDGCGNTGYSTIKTYTVIPDQIPPTIFATPQSESTICVGSTVSATFGSGSGGTGTSTDKYEFRINGGTWEKYINGTDIVATVEMVGPNTISIRSYRESSGTGCDETYNVVQWSVNSLPEVYTVGGGGANCYDGSGVSITLSGSEAGFTYELWKDGSATGTTLAGTGIALSFDHVMAEGDYRVKATDDEFGCVNTMIGNVTVSVRPEFTAGEIKITGESISYLGDPVRIESEIAASGGDENITYKWQSSIDGTNFTEIPNSDAASYDPSNLMQTTWFKRLAKDGTCNPTFTESAGVYEVTISEDVALQYLQDNTHLTTVSGTISDLTATFPASIPPVILAEPYKINSKMMLSGDVVPAGSTVDIQVTVDGVGPIAYVTGATIPSGPFWVTDLNGGTPSDFNSTYGGKIELYSITIHSGGGNPLALNGLVKVESIISKDGFSTNTVLDEISLNWTIPADEAAALAWLQDNTHLTTVSGTISDLTATFPASIPPVILAEPYKINSKMTLSGDVVPVGSTVDIQVTINGAGPISYVTGATIPVGPFWVTDLNGGTPSDFNSTYGDKIELYSITIHSGGGNPLALNGLVKVESIISKNGFSTNTVLDEISLNWTIPADEAAALSWLQNNTHLTTVSGTISDLTATFPASIPPVILAEPYKINSKMTLSGDIVPTGSTVDIQVTVNGVGPIAYVTGATIPEGPFWVTDLNGGTPSDFNSTYGDKIELYSITINSGGGNPFALNGLVKVESIISKDGFITNIVLDEISLNWTIPDAIALPLTVTGFTANSEPMTGSLVDGYELNTDNNPATNYMLQFAEGSEAQEPMKDEVAGLYLSPTAGQTDELVAYYESKDPLYKPYLDDAAAGNTPFAYIKTGGSAIRILDGAQYNLATNEVDMVVPGNYPLGTYTVNGTVKDLAGNPTPVSYILIVTGDRVKPEITLTGAASVSICQREIYVDAGASAEDDIDGNISSSIVVVNPIDIDIPYTYTITYNVSDAAGNAATEVIRTVVVKPNPTISGVNVSDESACFGSSVDFTINGLLNGSTDFVYSIAFNGETPVETTANGILVFDGTATFSVGYPAVGIYAIKVISAAVHNCSTTFTENNTASFIVHPIPSAPTVTVVDHHNGTSTLIASDYEGTLMWSTNETTNPITVNTGGVYTITQTINGCTSSVGSGFVNPSPTTNILAPIQETCGVYKVDVTVQDFINIGSISLKLNFDPLVIEYLSAEMNSELVDPLYDGNNSTGQFSLSYMGAGIDLPDDAVLCTIHFMVNAGIPVASTPLIWSKVAAACEYAGFAGVPVYFSSFVDNTISVSNCKISGTLVYDNLAQTPMNKVELTLTPGNKTVKTDDDGSFSFTGLHDGTYTISITDNQKEVGYINSTDAGAANSWTSAGGTIDYVKFLAGDVANNDLYINATDAQRIQKFFVNGTPFDKESWCYWKKGDMISNNYGTKPVNFDVTVGGANVVGFDLFGMCTGDFNGSFIPTILKSTNSFVKLNSYSSLQVGPSQEFELPIRSELSLEIGAVSLIIQIPSDLLKVQHIFIKDSNVPVDWIQKGDELRIGWYSSESVHIREGESLLTLRLFSSADFSNGENVEISLKSNLLNELADASFDKIQGVKLEVSKILSLATDIPDKLENKALLISNYPNPFKNSTTIDYTLPVDGKVSIVVYNQLQQVITTLVDENQTAGQHTVRMDSKYITPGIYIAKIRLTKKDVDSFGTVKLSVLK